VRRVLVLLHGFSQTGASWDPVRAALRAAPDPVLAPDLRGHGAASAVRPVSLSAVLADLDALLAAGAALAGYSMGGRIALHSALAHPGRLARLVLIGASPGLADPAERAARRAADEALAARVEAGSIEAFADAWGALGLWAGQPPAVAAAARADRLANDPAGLAAALRGVGTGAMEPLWGRLGELTMPAAVLAGERDPKFAALARRLAAGLPRATLRIVPGAGHALPLEAPDEVAAAIAERAETDVLPPMTGRT